MLSCVVYFTYCVKKSICPRNPRGISSLIVGNPPSSARWRRITQILGFAPTIVQLSSTVNICESLLFGSVDFWANTGFVSFWSSQRYLCLRTIFLFCNQSRRSWEFIHEGLARSVLPCDMFFYHKRSGIYKLTPAQFVSHRLAKGATPLMCSILSGAFEAAAILLAAGASAFEGRC